MVGKLFKNKDWHFYTFWYDSDMTIEKQLKHIVPGKTYPAYVKVAEPEGMVVEFHLNSYFVGMYCAIHVNGELAQQTGDYDNKKFCKNLKRDIKKALERGATVTIGSIRQCKTELSD